MYELDKGTNGVYSLIYHFITCVKYRKKVFTNDDIINDTKNYIQQIANSYDVKILGMECGEDHIHILIRTKPTLDFKSFIQGIKGKTSRMLRSKYAEFLSDKLYGDNFWSPSYFLATTGNVTIDVLKEYVENQRQLGNEKE